MGRWGFRLETRAFGEDAGKLSLPDTIEMSFSNLRMSYEALNSQGDIGAIVITG